MFLKITQYSVIELHGNRSFNWWVELVVLERKVFKLEVEDVLYFGIQFHGRQWKWFPGQL